jgi:hypothetical protein
MGVLFINKGVYTILQQATRFPLVSARQADSVDEREDKKGEKKMI